MRRLVRTARETEDTLTLSEDEEFIDADTPVQVAWQETLRETVLGISPDAFERLCQRLLRDSGFIQVEVTGRSGDGDIDGHGIVKIAGLLSFPIIFKQNGTRVVLARVRSATFGGLWSDGQKRASSSLQVALPLAPTPKQHVMVRHP